ncbi:tannase/feruloyl esterase family alpha/beta hydrolase [Kibdelosporangium phytohabitans]|uniref:Uncharacterized protein n=1 Tax=Kibdelosporangium phytohabitans TaxID=860235 RepID=A0A0N9HV25_9PSEU|nr:tannase/feruloyl esterase family alpha/beta hydrolase [Kibdelosporangium phytohabitans]ALG09075.1 hypothetical protein AOZ06_21065 [Kibdelosporangium phytohabitans]MBE1469733.1 hypothetical protein [Kibdelosporangium phytohabitans]
MALVLTTLLLLPLGGLCRGQASATTSARTRWAWPRSSLKYYDRAVHVNGGVTATQRFHRLFMVSGKNPCSGAGLGETADPLRLLDGCVKQGIAPDSVTVQPVLRWVTLDSGVHTRPRG